MKPHGTLPTIRLASMTAVVFVLGWALLPFIAVGAATGFDPAKLARMDEEINRAITQHQLPGGVLWLESKGHIYHKAFGFRALVPKNEPMTEDTIFDVASLTKVLATTPALLVLYERGKISLDTPVARYLPQFNRPGNEAITLRQLLTHTSGLGRTVRGFPDWSDKRTALDLLSTQPLANAPGTVFLYSDLNFVILGQVVQRVAGVPLNDFATREIFAPLKMRDTAYLPPADKIGRIAPTERIGATCLHGTVHDPKARLMGGVAGHAGVFTTAADMARFVRMILQGGELDGTRLFKPETIQLMTRNQLPPSIQAQRGLGWDIDSDYSRPRGQLFPIGSYGHTGFTGVCLWVDPASATFWIFLSNRVHPNQSGNISALQRTLGTLAAEASRVNISTN